MHPRYDLAAVLASTLWAGVVLGISFVAQPAKFKTPQLQRPVALATGRQMFQAMHRTECVLAALSLIFALAPPAHGAARLLPAAAAVLLVLQMAWLMPPLSQRVDSALAGAPPPPSRHHALFAVTEVLKFLALLAFPASLLFTPTIG
jgi:hypothetical protein